MNNQYNESLINSIDNLLTNKTQKWVLSGYSAASVWGFSNSSNNKIEVTFPLGQKSSKITDQKDYFSIVTNAIEKYKEGLVELEFNGKKVLVYDAERTIVELIKKQINSIDDILVDTIKSFIKNVNYDLTKLYHYAKVFKIETDIKLLFEVMKRM